MRRAGWLNCGGWFYRHHDRWRHTAIANAPGSALLLSGNRYNCSESGTRCFSPFVAKGDNGKWQANDSSIGGDLASSALSKPNLYSPESNRGAGLVLGNFAIATAERIGASLAQEFLFARFTRKGGHVKLGTAIRGRHPPDRM